MTTRPLTRDQSRLLQQLLVSPTGTLVAVHHTHQQIARTIHSLRRKGLINATFRNKLPGAKYSYGYRAWDISRCFGTPPQGTKLPAVKGFDPDVEFNDFFSEVRS